MAAKSTCKCKEPVSPACSEHVEYEPELVPGSFVRLDFKQVDVTSPKVVYLTCPLGHTNRYVVQHGKLS